MLKNIPTNDKPIKYRICAEEGVAYMVSTFNLHNINSKV
jgi:hypothetical protein